MKKFLGIALALMMFGCDFGTESKKEVPIPIPKDNSVKIYGKIGTKNSDGKNVSSVVCLENSGKCVQTNSNGEYYFNFKNNIAARKFGDDTTQTPEIVVIDTNELDGSDTTFSDTVVVYKNSRILYEIPVTSWKEILPEKYIVQRNISGKIVYNGYNNELKVIEAVYWNTDSIALVIPLEISNNKLSYSGFVYQAYNDSSFQFALKVNSMFIRAIDTADSVFAISNVENYSERTGDLNNVFDDLILGSLRKYPKSNMFVTFKDGDSIPQIIADTIKQNIWILPVDFEDIFARNLWKTESKIDTVTFKDGDSIITRYESKYVLSEFDSMVLQNLDNKNIDSVYITFNSDQDTSVNIQTYWLGRNSDINIKPGKNVYGFKWDSKIFSNNTISITIPCIVSDISLLIKFKINLP